MAQTLPQQWERNTPLLHSALERWSAVCYSRHMMDLGRDLHEKKVCRTKCPPGKTLCVLSILLFPGVHAKSDFVVRLNFGPIEIGENTYNASVYAYEMQPQDRLNPIEPRRHEVQIRWSTADHEVVTTHLIIRHDINPRLAMDTEGRDRFFRHTTCTIEKSNSWWPYFRVPETELMLRLELQIPRIFQNVGLLTKDHDWVVRSDTNRTADLHFSSLSCSDVLVKMAAPQGSLLP